MHNATGNHDMNFPDLNLDIENPNDLVDFKFLDNTKFDALNPDNIMFDAFKQQPQTEQYPTFEHPIQQIEQAPQQTLHQSTSTSASQPKSPKKLSPIDRRRSSISLENGDDSSGAQKRTRASGEILEFLMKGFRRSARNIPKNTYKHEGYCTNERISRSGMGRNSRFP